MGVPFRGSRAIASGRLTKDQLRRNYQRVYRDVYVRKGLVVTARVRALCAAAFCDGDCVLVGKSAAALLGAKWVDASAPAEVVRPTRCRPPSGMIARQDRLDPSEVTTVRGVRVTTPARTAFDLGRRLPRRDAVALIDALCNVTGLDPAAIARVAAQHPGARGVRRLRAILPLIDGGADSPPESDLRLVLIDAGLPRPATQVKVRDSAGGFIAACDLGWPEWKVIVEYDGDDHWGHDRRAADIERYELIESAGWTVIRVSSKLLYQWTDDLVDRVRTKLRAAGAPV